MNKLVSVLHWLDPEQELPNRDIPVLAIVRDGKRTFCAPTHRLARGWQGVKPPAQIIRWAPMPKPPTTDKE